ncbi:MAG: hypothetical protein M1813_004121 [Trichoglossum hirsutum]|nr:MAG: hypothetical protein M1813_004121 [Trichoglossum hirsutum]
MDACRLTNGDYKVGWVCALPVELSAAMAMLDEKHPQLPKEQRDPNAAAAVVTQMVSSFKSIEFGLMVGIGGGVPSAKHDIRLGDVVVSVPGPRCGGVIQYDFGKTVSGGQFIRTGSLNSPSPMLLGAEYDQLFEATYDHNIGGDGTCEECDTSKLLQRSDRDSSDSVVHYGVIASGNSVVKDGAIRDRLGETDDVLCFEMEAAGLMDNLPSIVIRGICDYADSHKNKRWQQYAAATAATYAKELLGIIQHQVTQSEGNQSQRQDRDADMQSAPNPQIGYYNDTFSTVHNRASVFVKNGKYGDALKCYRAILDGHTEALADDPKAHSILTTIRNIASAFLKGENYKDALEWHLVSLDSHMKALGNEHTDTRLILTTVYCTARLLLKGGNNQNALNWYQALLDGNVKVFGNEHPDTRSILSDILRVAPVFWKNGKYHDALGWYRVLLDSHVTVFGKEHSETRSILLTIRGVPSKLSKGGKYKDALEWYQASLDGHVGVLGKEHAETHSVLYAIRDENAALALLKGGIYKNALEWYQLSLVGHIKVFGKEHPETRPILSTIRNIALVLRKKKEYKDAREWERVVSTAT